MNELGEIPENTTTVPPIFPVQEAAPQKTNAMSGGSDRGE